MSTGGTRLAASCAPHQRLGGGLKVRLARRLRRLAALALALGPTGLLAQAVPPPQPIRPAPTVQQLTLAAPAPTPPWLVCGGERSQLPLWSLFVLPGERGDCEIQAGSPAGGYRLQGPGVQVQTAGQRWSWQAPAQPGLVQLRLEGPGLKQPRILQLWVMTPAAAVVDGRLQGFRIGQYPGNDGGRGPLYGPPRGYVEVTPANAATRVSPEYRLGQFVSKQSPHYPKYVVLRTRLLEKLEWLTTAARLQGMAEGPFVVMSGYRTPYYNARLGNRPLSRHQWGGAADVYIDDRPRDGHMEDLNGDGRLSREDAVWLAQWIERQAATPAYRERFIGGLGIYGSTSSHGPFVHIDVRGVRARW